MIPTKIPISVAILLVMFGASFSVEGIAQDSIVAGFEEKKARTVANLNKGSSIPILPFDKARRRPPKTTSSALLTDIQPTSTGWPLSHGPFIWNGNEALADRWRPMVALIHGRHEKDNAGENQFCGGTLIADTWVLTAAHCVKADYWNYGKVEFFSGKIRLGYQDVDRDVQVTPGEIHILVGSNDLNDWGEDYTKPVDRIPVKKIVRAPISYNRLDGTPLRDLALLELERPPLAKVCYDLMAVQSPSDADISKPGKKVWAAGWGQTEKGEPAKKIREVEIEVVDTAVCNKPLKEAIYEDKKWTYKILLWKLGIPDSDIDQSWNALKSKVHDPVDESMLCAGDLTHQKDSCWGDSGGPLAADIGGKLKQVAVVSWGRGCGTKKFHGVYARLDSGWQWEWIKKTIGHEPRGVNRHRHTTPIGTEI